MALSASAVSEERAYDDFRSGDPNTIVEWIDDNLHQPLRIDDIARHAGYSKWHLQRLFLQYKGRALGRYIRERLLLAARDLRDTDQRVYDICLKYGFDSQQTFAASLPGPSISPPGAYRKENHSRAHWGALVLTLEENQRRHTQRSTRYSMAPSASEPQTKTAPYRAG